MDLFETEQQIYENALNHISTIKDGADCDPNEFSVITKSYGKLLKQLRRLTKASDETTGSLHNKAIDIAEKDHAKSRFLARMSHEIRTPISAVLGISEIQLQDPSLSLKTEEAFAKIYNSANTLLGIVNDILDLSKIEAGKMSIVNTEYDVADMINDVVQLNDFYLANKDIDFIIKVDKNLPTHLFGDELRIKQILNNLLSNSFKYTSEGFVQFSVQFKDCPQDDENMILSLTIRDTGHGMTPEQLEDLHSEYSRFHEKEHRSVQGKGLGMSITFSLVQLMEATLNITSKVNEGTTLVLEIPQKISSNEVLGFKIAEDIENREAGARTAKLSFTPEPMPYGRVLVVDDVDTNIYVAKGLLSFFELEIETTDSGYGAIEKIKSGEVYDIVFMDHMMPGLDGIETTKILRDMGYTYPIVALTANALIGQSEEFLQNGFDNFIGKPIQILHLNALLNKFIRDKYPIEIVEAARAKSEIIEPDEDEHDYDEFIASPEMAELIRSDFIKSQENVVCRIRDAIESDDIKQANLLAHTLRSHAALMNEKLLESLAASVEECFRNNEPPASNDMEMLEVEVNKVFEKLSMTI